MEKLQNTLGFAGCFAVNSVGLSGGIGLFWSQDFEVELKNYSSGHIDTLVRRKGDAARQWRLTGFYGAPRVEDRHQSWRFLRTLFAIQHGAWMCVGDFNETLLWSEHFSYSPRPEWQMKAFREAVDDCSLSDLGWSGAEYTWDNRQSGRANVKARLDRAFGNPTLMGMFEHIKVRHIVATESDHSFVFVDLWERLNSEASRGPKLFRYEDVWQTHVDYDRLVFESWRKGAGSQGLDGITRALSAMQSSLATWGAKEFGSLTRKVRKLREKLTRLRGQSVGRGPSEEEKTVVKQLRLALKQEEIWMRQRSRVPWLREGDRNTGYFHAQAAQRKRMNKIERLERADGSICADLNEDRAEVQAFYQALYTSQGFHQMDELLQFVPTRVTEAMNHNLQKPYTEEEVR